MGKASTSSMASQSRSRVYKSSNGSRSLRSGSVTTTTRQRTPTLKYEPAPRTYRDNYTSTQRSVILKKNADKNGGFYTCENCRFQHKQSTYATLKGGRMGDGSFHVDHKTPASNGGMASKCNSAVLCGTCNTSKGNRLAAKATGMDKYKGLHRKSVPKDYIRKPRVKKR